LKLINYGRNKYVKEHYMEKAKGWYRSTPGHVPKPTRQDEEKSRKFNALLQAQQSTGDTIPIPVNPFPIDGSIPKRNL
jgi:hypothetical protein